MSTVFYSAQTLRDIEQLAEFLLLNDPQAAAETGALLIEAITTLSRHPLLGRIVEHGLRELVISRGRTGYVALYRFDAESDQVFILTIRHQREIG